MENETKKGSIEDAESSAVQSEAELIGRIIQSEQKLSDYFTTIITKSVTDQLERRNTARLRLIGMVSLVLVSVIIPAVTLWIRGAIETQADAAIEERFRGEVVRLEANFQGFLNHERQYSSLANQVIYLAQRNDVPKNEIIEIVRRLTTIAGDLDLTSRPEFPDLLDLVVLTTLKNSAYESLAVIEEQFPDAIARSPQTTMRLARFYGRNILGNRFVARTRLDETTQRFERYLASLERSADLHRLLPLQMMVITQIGDEHTEEQLEAARLHVLDLAPGERAAFIVATVRSTNPDFWDLPNTARNRRVAISAGRLVVGERPFFSELLDDRAVQTALYAEARELANAEQTDFSAALSGFQNVFSADLTSADVQAAVQQLVRTEIRPWLRDKIILEALRAQNRETAGVSPARIQQLEKQWQEEYVSGAHELIEAIMERPVSRYLRRVKLDGVGLYREIYLMDAVGLLTGAVDPDNAYWYGETPDWLQSFKAGPDAVYISSLEFDESALAWVIQISVPVVDPKTDVPIGAISVSLDPGALDNSL